ncbi:hypothetical protein PYCCODRAFT_488651 [Trametes coccinea BRFM310]|uniref:Uncharacterized protein n=1 Tax=Trametes coccinea (strain BRFM310) TaxID=1353009 RepID=A0A1Y2IKF2_TRAC3|nr:hypothetical protein PYCCODRAFT_488651 [Trametes coccinea BRFM310]
MRVSQPRFALWHLARCTATLSQARPAVEKRPCGVGPWIGEHGLTYECCLCAFREDLLWQFLAFFHRRLLRG